MKLLLRSSMLAIMLLSLLSPALAEIEVGEKAPDFTLPAVGAEDPVSLSDYIDKKIVIVHFWKSR